MVNNIKTNMMFLSLYYYNRYCCRGISKKNGHGNYNVVDFILNYNDYLCGILSNVNNYYPLLNVRNYFINQL